MPEVYMICWYDSNNLGTKHPMYDKVYLYLSTAQKVRDSLQDNEKSESRRYYVNTLTVSTVSV